MSFWEFLKKNLITYFIIVTGITAIMALLGGQADPGRSFGYEAYYSPLIYGAIAVVPSLALYSKKELTFRQMLFRRILHFIVLEIFIIVSGLIFGSISVPEIISLASFVFMVYLFTNIIVWFIDRRTMIEINKGLKRLQG